MATVIRTSLQTILPVIRVRLQDVTGLPPERAGMLQRDEPPFNAHGDNYLFGRVEDSQFDTPIFDGAGRIDLREEVLFSVTIRSRLATDEANMDVNWLNDEALGNLRLRHLVLDALVCFQPIDNESNWLATEPIKPSRARRPRKEPKGNKDWGESVLWFEMKYMVDLTQSYQ